MSPTTTQEQNRVTQPQSVGIPEDQQLREGSLFSYNPAAQTSKQRFVETTVQQARFDRALTADQTDIMRELLGSAKKSDFLYFKDIHADAAELSSHTRGQVYSRLSGAGVDLDVAQEVATTAGDLAALSAVSRGHEQQKQNESKQKGQEARLEEQNKAEETTDIKLAGLEQGHRGKIIGRAKLENQESKDIAERSLAEEHAADRAETYAARTDRRHRSSPGVDAQPKSDVGLEDQPQIAKGFGFANNALFADRSVAKSNS